MMFVGRSSFPSVLQLSLMLGRRFLHVEMKAVIWNMCSPCCALLSIMVAVAWEIMDTLTNSFVSNFVFVRRPSPRAAMTYRMQVENRHLWVTFCVSCTYSCVARFVSWGAPSVAINCNVPFCNLRIILPNLADFLVSSLRASVGMLDCCRVSVSNCCVCMVLSRI